HHARRHFVILHGCEQPGFAELAWKRRRGGGRRRLLELCNVPRVIIERVDRTVAANSKARYLYRARREFFVPRDLLRAMIVTKSPDLPVLIVAVEIGVAQLFEFGALIDVAAGNGAAFRVVMFHDRRNDRRRAPLPSRLKWM